MPAIALAESSGVATRHNPIPPDDSYGLWQINMIGSLGPQRRARFGITSNAQLYDPVINARAALAIYNQQGLRAWSTYLYGQYRKYLAASQAAYRNRVAPVVNATVSAINPVIPFPSALNFNYDVIDSVTPGKGADAGISAGALLLIGAAVLGIYLIAQ